MGRAVLIFPNQLFADHPLLGETTGRIVLIEDPLFFGDRQYPLAIHKQRLWLHRASMKRYFEGLRKTANCAYIDYRAGVPLLRDTLDDLSKSGVTEISTLEPVDHALERRLKRYCDRLGLSLCLTPTPLFLNTTGQNQAWRNDQKRWFMAEYYKFQRRRLDILMDGDSPVGGQWSFDEDNRKKVPKKRLGEAPRLKPRAPDRFDTEAKDWVEQVFPDNPGALDTLYWPTTHKDAETWLETFLTQRFSDFGPYEDAIVEGKSLLWHGALTPMLNIGLLTPQQIIDAAVEHAATHDIPINSLEGFLRQIIGWREFMRATYEDLGVQMRTTNHWAHTRPMPDAFWTGETGIDPIDDTIRRLLNTGYCHHIERLMVLGGFMFLCEIDPKEIYRWFMAMFVDAYDWVMVPNVYAMSQNADGGLITTKPYFSGSAYVRKMSHWKTGDWSQVWDGLYWRWINKNADALEKNPRWTMMVSMARKMEPEKRAGHLDVAGAYLATL